VTGASGFIGRALVADLAARGYAVRAASRRPEALALPRGAEGALVERHRSPNLSNDADFASLLAGVDVVIHAAAIAHTQGIAEEAFETVNHRAVGRLAEAARGKAERFVFLSSIRAQSGTASPTLLTEADTPRPADPYGRAKLAAEKALACSGTPFVVLRPVLVAGPNPSGNLAALLRLANRGLPLSLDGFTARRSLVALADVTAAVAHVLEGAAHLGETYILSHPDPVAVGAIFAALREGLGRKAGGLPVPVALLRALLALTRQGAMRERLFGDLAASPAKLMATGWSPHVSPHAALVEMGALYRAGRGANSAA
jgi:UDP-glucose 4-epimerase